MASLEELRRSVAVRTKPVLQTCTPPMLFFSTLPCTADVVDAVLFPKDMFQRRQQRLRALLGERPGTPQARLEWCKKVTSEIEHALNDTNILDNWLLGSWAPVDILNAASSVQAIPTLNTALWRNANEYVWGLTRRAAALRPAFGSFELPLTDFANLDPWAAVNHQVDAWGYVTDLNPGRWRLRQFHSKRDFTVPVVNEPPVNTRGLGLAPGGASGAGASTLGRSQMLTQQVRDALGRAFLETSFRGRVSQENGVRMLVQHFTSHPGRDLQIAFATNPNTNQRVYAVLPGAEAVMGYYAAIARDILETPYEMFILFGIEKWVENLAVWAQRGRINISAERVVGIARDVTQARSRMVTGGSFAITAGIASAVNPIAGVVIQALGTLADLALSSAGAVAYWNCPYPLTRRSAAGDCDFSKVIGPEALERAQRQAAGVTAFFQERTQSPGGGPQVIEAGVNQNLLLIGAGLALAVGVGYFLLKE